MGFAWRSRQGAVAAVQAAGPAAVGIDLGTGYGRIAIWKDGDVLIVPNERGSFSTPSCVAFADGGAVDASSPGAPRVLVGEAAEEQADENLENTIFAPQRFIGSKFDNPWVQWCTRHYPYKVCRGDDDQLAFRIAVGDNEERCYRPEELVSFLLAYLRRTAERHLGTTVVDAVVTVPSCFGPQQREAMLQACRGARLNVLDLLKAPTCAAIAYTLAHARQERRNVLVCDAGASYFDFGLLTIEDHGGLVERAIGTDWVDMDMCMTRFCTQDLREKWDLDIAESVVARYRLRRACEMAKRQLSQYSHARIQVQNIFFGQDYVCNLSRIHFDELIRADVEPLLDPIEWCLEDCGLERHDVHEVVLVGGSARIPILRRAVKEFFYGKKPLEVLRPEHAAVLGAAAYAAVLAGDASGNTPNELAHIRVAQVTPWTMAAPGADPARRHRTGKAVPCRSVQGSGDAAAGSPRCAPLPGGLPAVPQMTSGAAETPGPGDVGGRVLRDENDPAPPKPIMRPSFSELSKPSSLREDVAPSL